MRRLAGIFAAFILIGGAYSPAIAQEKSLTVFAAGWRRRRHHNALINA